MKETYTELLKKSLKVENTTDYIFRLLSLFDKGKISIDVCQAEIAALIDNIIEKTGDINARAIKRQRKKIAELEQKIDIYQVYAALSKEEEEDNPNHESFTGFTFLLSVYRTVVANTGEVWVRKLSEYRPEVDVFNRYDEKYHSDHRKEIADVLDDGSISVNEKKHLLNNIFDRYEKMSIVLPVIDRATEEEEVLLRNIRAYGKLMEAIFDSLIDLKNSEVPNSYRIYTAVVSKYFLKNVTASKQQLIWYKDRMRNIGDTEACEYSRKTLDRNIKIGVSYMLDRYNVYIDKYITENPDIVFCIQRVRGIIKNKKITSDYFLLSDEKQHNLK